MSDFKNSFMCFHTFIIPFPLCCNPVIFQVLYERSCLYELLFIVIVMNNNGNTTNKNNSHDNIFLIPF